MKTAIIKIGNSKGIRIPKPILEQCGFADEEVDLEVQNHELIIRSVNPIRSGWTDAFSQMAKFGDDALIGSVAEPGSVWDEEWEWK